MAILDRPLFQRRPTKDELRRYGLPAFANGGVIKMRNGGLPFTPNIKPETAITDLVEDRPTLPATGMTIPSSVYEESREPLPEFTPEIKPIPEKKQKLMDEEKEREKKQKEIEDLDELKKKYLEKSELYKELLGNPKEMIKQQGFLQLAQFGLNLASAQGSNFLDKVAKSATDPLNAFAELGRKAYEDERAVNLLALEATERDIESEREAELEKEIAALEAEGGTTFQQNLATIQSLLPDLQPLDQVKIAKGLRLGETKEDKVQRTFEIISGLPIFSASPDLAMQKAIELVEGGPKPEAVTQEGLTAVGTGQGGRIVYQNQEGKFVYADGSPYVEPKE